MTRGQAQARIEAIGIIPAVRAHSREDALFALRTISKSGIPIIELTMTTPGALEIIAECASSDLIVGAGTVLDIETARRCHDAGAAFVTSPGLDVEVVEFAVGNKLLVIPGALTPTDVMTAHKAGADFIKIFPCAQVGGPAYIRALKAPFPHVHFVASGGVTQRTAVDFIHSGATALGIGEDLIPHDAVQSRNESWIGELARRFLGMVREARSAMEAG